MYCDANGTPNPNGDYEMIGGKLCLRDGRRISFQLRMMDGKSAGTTADDVSDAWSDMVRDLTAGSEPRAGVVRDGPTTQTITDAELESAYTAMVRDLTNAWKR